jgi:hypothetical protein
MALLDKILGSNNAQKLRLIRELTRFRIQSDPSASLMGIDPNQVDSMSDSQLMMLPEASIATIAESYVQLVRSGSSPQSALSRIDNHRSSGFGGARSNKTTNIFDYVFDRMRIEHDQSQAYALDQAFIDGAVSTSAKIFGMELELPERPPYETVKEFLVSSYRIVIAKYQRREGGYLFPWRLLAFEPGVDDFAFSYNLEVTPITCSLGCYTAEGMHLNLGEGNPSMSLHEFEAWAVPMAKAAIEKINADHGEYSIPTDNHLELPEPIGFVESEDDSEEPIALLEQAYDDGEIDYLEYKTERNRLVMDQAVSNYKSTNFDHEHAKNVIAYEDGDISLEQHLETYRALLISEVTKVMLGRLDALSKN